MKIYISEKEIQEKELDMKQHPKHEVVITKWVVSNDLGDVNDSEEYCVDIKSLEQHDKELVENLYSYLLKPKSWRLMKSAWADDEHSTELKELLEKFLKERGVE